MSVKHKFTGFLAAIAIAIISFFVIYLFIPEFSEKYLGTSLRSDRYAKKTVLEKSEDLLKKTEKEATSTLSTVSDRLGEFFGK